MDANGLISIPTAHSVDFILDRLTAMLAAKSVKLFAIVDHSGEAAKAGLHMPPTKLVIFGNPETGTPLMLASPDIAIDLPLKLLIAEDLNGKVTLTYNSPEYLRKRHKMPEELLANITIIDGLAQKISG